MMKTLNLDGILCQESDFRRWVITAMSGSYNEVTGQFNSEEIYTFDNRSDAAEMFDQIASNLDRNSVHSVSCWAYESTDDKPDQLYIQVDSSSVLPHEPAELS